jgi:hypothetical protein
MSDRVTELLLKAIRQLSQDERDEVLAGFLAGRAFEPEPLGPLGRTSAVLQPLREWPSDLSMNIAAGMNTDPIPQLKVLPVRLPSADYDRLRTFSREHGFSMAVIIRTLVERFLDERAAPAPSAGPPAAPSAGPPAAPSPG